MGSHWIVGSAWWVMGSAQWVELSAQCRARNARWVELSARTGSASVESQLPVQLTLLRPPASPSQPRHQAEASLLKNLNLVLNRGSADFSLLLFSGDTQELGGLVSDLQKKLGG